MTEASKMNPFKKRLYDEFEDHAYKVLGVSGERVREVLGERGHDIDADFEAAYEFAGAAFMRQKMSHILCSLELVYYETEIGRQLTEDESLTIDDLGSCKMYLLRVRTNNHEICYK